jgi:hypothetical protein
MKAKLAMQLTQTALVVGLVATAGAPSRAIAGGFVDNTPTLGQAIQQNLSNPRLPPPGSDQTPCCTPLTPPPVFTPTIDPTFNRPPQQQPLINSYQQQYAPQPPQTRTINTLSPAALNAQAQMKMQQMQHQLWLQRYPVLSSHVGFGGRLPQMGFGGQRIGTGRGCGGWFRGC